MSSMDAKSVAKDLFCEGNITHSRLRHRARRLGKLTFGTGKKKLCLSSMVMMLTWLQLSFPLTAQQLISREQPCTPCMPTSATDLQRYYSVHAGMLH